MRRYALLALLIAGAVTVCPAAALSENNPSAEKSVTVQAERDNAEFISVMRTQSGTVNEVEITEYLVGCVAAEMPASYHPQALMAQAVACFTYAKRQSENGGKDSFVSDNPDEHQGYIDKAQRMEKWGDDFEENEAKITAAVKAVSGRFLTFEGKTALTVYHCINAGSTQSAENLWGSEIPYLTSVLSIGDKLSPDYKSTEKFSETEIKSLASELGISLEGEVENWLGKVKRSDDGYVVSVGLGDGEISGATLREKLGLRSNFFEIYYSGGKFVVDCCGYGHCVGMSQYGADYMARQGSSWQEILAHYYPGTKLE